MYSYHFDLCSADEQLESIFNHIQRSPLSTHRSWPKYNRMRGSFLMEMDWGSSVAVRFFSMTSTEFLVESTAFPSMVYFRPYSYSPICYSILSCCGTLWNKWWFFNSDRFENELLQGNNVTPVHGHSGGLGCVQFISSINQKLLQETLKNQHISCKKTNLGLKNFIILSTCSTENLIRY